MVDAAGPSRVVLITTGGTIASRPGEQGGYRPQLAGAALLDSLREVPAGVRIDVVEFSLKPSYMMTMPEVIDLVALVREQTRQPEVAAVVVTVGTAGMEEIAYLLDLLIPGPCPVVVTGAMLNAAQLGYDGSRNLHDALRVAVDPEGTGKGTMVCMAGEVHAARDVRKMHRTSIASFVSRPNGPLALADADRIVWLREPLRRYTFDAVTPVHPVDVIPVVLGDDGRQVRAAMATGARGLVIEGFPGGGGVTSAVFDAVVAALARGIPVLTTSRSPFGRVVPVAAGGAGPRDLVAAGTIPCGDLPAPKARLLLMCALATTADHDRLQAIVTAVAP